MKILLIFLIVGVSLHQAIAAEVKPAPRCARSHEVYNTCGSACPSDCDNYKNPPACTRQCVAGCFCEAGYVRNLVDNTCCLPTQCPVSQPICTQSHEVYKECGTACPATCKNYKDSIACTDQCVPGCYCEEGYVRNTADNTCCLPTQCPQVLQPVCTQNEVYTSCGTACPITCTNYKNPPKVCTMQCIIGCVCKNGYVRDTVAGTCCLPTECKPIGYVS